MYVCGLQGLLTKSIAALRADQEERRQIDPETTQRIDDFLAKLALMASGLLLPFTVIVTDPGTVDTVERV